MASWHPDPEEAHDRREAFGESLALDADPQPWDDEYWNFNPAKEETCSTYSAATSRARKK